VKTGKGAGARTGPGHLIGLAFLREWDCRRIACPRCGAKPVARCVRLDGTYAKNSHPERRQAFKEGRAQR
jgi:hypothetical protein